MRGGAFHYTRDEKRMSARFINTPANKSLGVYNQAIQVSCGSLVAPAGPSDAISSPPHR